MAQLKDKGSGIVSIARKTTGFDLLGMRVMTWICRSLFWRREAHVGPGSYFTNFLDFSWILKLKIIINPSQDIERYFCKLCLLERAAGYSLRDITLLRLFEALEAAPQVRYHSSHAF